jgi:hypothetical protein
MMQEGEGLSPHLGNTSSIEGQTAQVSAHVENDRLRGELALPPQAARILMELIETRTSFGPDPETARIIAETDRHAEEKKLEGYKATLEHRDHENERKHLRQIKRIGNESIRAWVVLVSSIVGAAVGIFLSVTGKSNLGIPLLLFAGILIKDLAGKPGTSGDSD